MDVNTIILLAVLAIICFSWVALFVLSGAGGYYYFNKDKFTFNPKTKSTLKEITCNVKINPDSYECVSMEDEIKMIKITMKILMSNK